MTAISAPPADRRSTFDDEAVHDLLRGVAALTGSTLVGDLARAVAKTPRADLSIAFNHKQLGSKLWLREEWIAFNRAPDVRALVVGGWHGALSALLLDDPRAGVAHATSLDIDPGCAPVARELNRRFAEQGRFEAVTADMYDFDYRAQPFDCVINTSCEHIADLRGWLGLLPDGATVVLQSNDYRREPDHIACVDSLEDFEAQAGLAAVFFRGERPTKNYRRFMLIGRR